MLNILGPSGVGKGTLIKFIRDTFKNKFEFSVSHTTRKIREGELYGVNYYYVSKEEFEEMIKLDLFVECANYNGNYYGTSKKELERIKELCTKNNSICLLELDIVGSRKLNDLKLGFEFIGILPPSVEVLKQRLTLRGTENEEQIETRLQIGKNEIDEINSTEWIKYKVVNDNLEDSTKKIIDIVLEIFPNQLKY